MHALLSPPARRARAPTNPGHPQGDRQRRLLLGFVAANPGVHVRRAAHVLGMNWNSCFHHVHRLEGQGLLVVRRLGGRLCLFDARSAAASQLSLVALKEERNAGIAAVVLRSPGINQSALARATGLAPSVLHRRLVRLEALGLVLRVDRSRETLVSPTPLMDKAWAALPTSLVGTPMAEQPFLLETTPEAEAHAELPA